MYGDIREQTKLILISPKSHGFLPDHLSGPFTVSPAPGKEPATRGKEPDTRGQAQTPVDKLKEDGKLKVREEVKQQLRVLPKGPSLGVTGVGRGGDGTVAGRPTGAPR